MEGAAGPSGFRNVEPLSRQERAAARDKDLLEKSRLQARNRGGPLKQPENVVGNPVMPARNAPAFCDEYDRFNRDVAGEMNAKKQQNLQKKEVGGCQGLRLREGQKWRVGGCPGVSRHGTSRAS